jgi:hypothetical protein
MTTSLGFQDAVHIPDRDPVVGPFALNVGVVSVREDPPSAPKKAVPLWPVAVYIGLLRAAIDPNHDFLLIFADLESFLHAVFSFSATDGTS